MGEETIRADDGALQLIIDALEDAKRVASFLREQAYEQQKLRRAAEYRAQQLADALHSVCTELRLERGCGEGACGTDRCFWSDCTAGPAMELLARCGSEAKTDG